MSRAGNRPIKIDEGVKVTIDSDKVNVVAEKGSLGIKILPGIVVKEVDGNVVVTRNSDEPDLRAKHGLIARLIKNAIEDLKNGVKKDLEFVGTGYRAKTKNEILVLTMGYSHDIELQIPKDMTATVKKNTITIEGSSRADVGEFAAKVREVRPPEVYKGKGIKYAGEQIKRKAGKAAQAAGKE